MAGETDVYARRQQEQADRERYREAARRLRSWLIVGPQAHVAPMADGSGAFVEVVVWIPKEHIRP